MSRRFRSVAPVLVVLAAAAACSAPQIPFVRGDHVVLVGNALADRMQHDGWLEAHLQSELPDLQLVIRNQGFAGDRIDHRPRVKGSLVDRDDGPPGPGFPSADEYLAFSQADVVVAMFGYNESFDGEPAQFADALMEWIDHTRAQDYSGRGAPRIVLVSPIAHENLDDASLPDGRENNARLAAYAEAMATVARQERVRYVDLFGPSQELYRAAASPLTINGIHLNSDGNRRVAEVIVASLLGRAPTADPERVEAVRSAVLDKNWHWFNRYRTTDGNDVWGTRSSLAFTDGQTNF